jgi:hypothetical protein
VGAGAALPAGLVVGAAVPPGALLATADAALVVGVGAALPSGLVVGAAVAPHALPTGTDAALVVGAGAALPAGTDTALIVGAAGALSAASQPETPVNSHRPETLNGPETYDPFGVVSDVRIRDIHPPKILRPNSNDPQSPTNPVSAERGPPHYGPSPPVSPAASHLSHPATWVTASEQRHQTPPAPASRRHSEALPASQKTIMRTDDAQLGLEVLLGLRPLP